MFGLRFIKAQPTTYLMKYRGGAVTQQGAGLSGFYYGPVTSLVAVPIGSRDTAFIFQQIARDFQALTIQGHVTYRISEPQKAAAMLNFTLKADGETYESDDPEKLPQRILATVEVLAQQAVKELTLKEALQASDRIAGLIEGGLRGRADIASLGLEILGVSIRGVKPTPDTAKALEAEAREAILKSADEAIFARRNFAVEQERAIRESELDTEIAVEQKKRSIRETQMDAEASVAAKQAELREAGMVADITLESKRKDFVGLNAENTRTLADAEAYRVGALMKIFEGVDTRVIQALAAAGMQPGQLIAQAFSGIAEKAEKIGQLNVSPDLLNTLLEKPAAVEAARARRQ
ncbi:regulator of protease activity HflC (stomatin/prohibitin superfamily) [Bradyrhizobium macuxiense]|uniref:Regulator of protease activity HflC (Stomatin/prohibitin superfamily) n=1 Tax=Bradyrhizobium macuxiense TaxID=1755647 RepID=A0A560L379_9BRAD|nr:SPFH domain-containing protein [Bradyrhizobium macuxiense]TWB89998.1 regulator of protease activity HflC (stomatin/prohibitin superfamily) [Bradyrhizobium macuxiense]